MDDTISRAAAIDVFPEDTLPWDTLDGYVAPHHVRKILEQLPSVQPEIIHCKECKYGVQDENKRWYCRSLGCQIGNEDGSGYCADAERRTDE